MRTIMRTLLASNTPVYVLTAFSRGIAIRMLTAKPAVTSDTWDVVSMSNSRNGEVICRPVTHWCAQTKSIRRAEEPHPG
jgi:hypothetical protein